MKLLFITPEGFDTPNPNNQMAEVMLNDFLNAGYEVTLIQSHRQGTFADIPKSLEERKKLKVITIKRRVIDKTNFIVRYFNDVHYALLAFRKWIKIKDVDVIYLQSNPTIIYPMRLLRLFRRKIPIVFSIYDVFPGHAYDIGVVKSKLLYNIMKFIEKPCYKMAAAITVLGEDMKDKVVEQGAKPEKVHVVPAWYDVSTAREIPRENNRFMQKYEIEADKFIVGFAGTVGFVFNYHTVIELAKRLIDYKDIEIQIVGQGNVRKKFMNEAKELGLTNITFYPLQPVELVPDVYSTCNVAIIPLQKGVIGNGIPSKAPILMACRRPIINSCEIESHYARQFIVNKMGESVDIFDYDGLAAAVLKLKNSPELIAEYAENGYNFVKDNYSSTKSLEKLKNVINSLV